jgi:hypothetical protein
VAPYTGLALAGLLHSARHRPAPWKAEVARKAAGYYREWWKTHKSLAFVPGHLAACAEGYRMTHDRVFADFAGELGDWLCGLQYAQIDPRHMLWYGGFRGCVEGRTVETAPHIGSAACAEALAEGCRVARETGDVARHQRYSEAVERCLQFLTTLQYTEATTQHFADWYRPRLVGAFHASHQDGNLRIDYTQQAVAALISYLEYVAP